MKKILIIKMDHLGDVLWSFPAIEAIVDSKKYGEHHILCTPYNESACKKIPGIDKVITYDITWPISKKYRLIRNLKKEKYDLALVMGPADKVNYLAYLSGARKRIGYYLAGKPLVFLADLVFMTKRYPHPADIAHREGKPLPHEVEALCGLVEKIGIKTPASPEIKFPVKDDEIKSAREIVYKKIGTDKPIASIQLCTKAFRYGWEGTNFIKLALEARSAFPGYSWFVIGGPLEERFLPGYILELEKNGIPVISGLKLGQVAGVFSMLDLFISWDTGVVHLALAMGTPVVDVFPAKDFDYCVRRWGPWKGKSKIIVQESSSLDENTRGQIIKSTGEFIHEGTGKTVGS
ncbi:MAG: glycosyltransferase family 9 protein [Candidatus Eremiobacteraeota bacterium]|nr:glycosyltransferase family 9 protein [Candidatus Eremiobacteraeota bacterium]